MSGSIRTKGTILLCLLLSVFGWGVSTASADVVSRLAEENKESPEEAKKSLNNVFAAIEKELVAGEEVMIRGFGKFYLSERDARQARHPKTGEKIQVPAKRYPKFRSSEKLKEKLNN